MQRGAELGTKDLIGTTAGEKAILASQIAVVQLVFGAESERQIELATVNHLREFKTVRQESGVVRRRINLLMDLESWAVHFQSSRDSKLHNVFRTE